LMQIIRYDGSFYGLISALVPFLKQRRLPDAVERENQQQPLLAIAETEPQTDAISVASGNLHDAELFRIPGISRETWQNAWYAFLSEEKNIELRLARYLLLALEKRGSVDAYQADERVRSIHRLARQVNVERHRFLGLLRFRSIGANLYYAAISSDTFVLPVLAPFFVRRFAGQQWIIHDRRREVAAVYNLKTWTIIERKSADIPPDASEESAAQHLWQCFFDSIAVRERLNLALQQKCIPKKYWHDLIEKPGR
ncbi:MAG TPA: TIGR03915 family putative DNA repair protein, partial [Candidatus Rifleibacterium sp.]|nr:TIGR03915 family putative DNA repair protein [Candidatus Rifleibacterium sp.]